MNPRRTCLIAVTSAVATVAAVALAGVGHPADAVTPPSAGQLLAFGDNTHSQLATASDNNAHPTPAAITLPGSDPIYSLATSDFTSFAITGSNLYGWGSNDNSQLAQAASTTGDQSIATPQPISLGTGAGTPLQVTAARDYTLALTSTNTIYGWGLDDGGVFGTIPKNQDQATPTAITFPTSSYGNPVQVSAGYDHVLVRTSTGKAVSFGDDSSGQLGYANANSASGQTSNPTPRMIPISGTVTAVSAGTSHSLVMTSDGKVYAFGANSSGQLGQPATTTSNSTPTLVALPANVTATQISAGSGSSLILGSDGIVYALGDNTYGQAGSTTSSNSVTTATPVTMPTGATAILRISAASVTAYAITVTGQLIAWGSNTYGGLASSASATKNLPAIVTTAGQSTDVVSVGASANSALTLVSNLNVNTTSLPSGSYGVAYSSTAASATGGYAGGNITWSAAGLPAGLVISTTTGALTGTPTVGGSFSVTLTATDAEGVTDSVVLPLSIAGGPPAPPVTTPPVTTPPVTTPPVTTPPVTTPPVTTPTPPAVTPPAPVVPTPVVTPTGPSTSAILSALTANLVPKNKSAAFATLSRKGYSQSVSVLAAGKLTVTWTYQPPKAKGAKKAPKPITVATGTATFSKTGASHVTVKLTKAGTALLKLGHKVTITFTATFSRLGQKTLVGTRSAKLS